MILKVMSEYKIPKGTIPTEEPLIEKEIEIQMSLDEKREISNEIVGEYVSVTKFLFEVSELALEKEIKFSIEKVAPIFKVFMEFEDEYIKITYDEGTKQGIINIKINAEN